MKATGYDTTPIPYLPTKRKLVLQKDNQVVIIIDT